MKDIKRMENKSSLIPLYRVINVGASAYRTLVKKNMGIVVLK